MFIPIHMETIKPMDCLVYFPLTLTAIFRMFFAYLYRMAHLFLYPYIYCIRAVCSPMFSKCWCSHLILLGCEHFLYPYTNAGCGWIDTLTSLVSSYSSVWSAFTTTSSISIGTGISGPDFPPSFVS